MTADRYGTVRFTQLKHDCSVPRFGVAVGEEVNYRWRCPECGQKWYVRADWRRIESTRLGRASRRWRRQRAAELLVHAHRGAS